MPNPIHNLTLPVSPFFPLGSIFPWDSPHQREDIVTIERNRAHLFFIRMGSGTGTRMRTRGFGRTAAGDTDEVELHELVNRETVILRIPKGPGEPIGPDDIVAAVREHDEHDGDPWTDAAVLLATGWGDDRRYAQLGEEYVLASPYLTPDAARELASVMAARGVTMLLTDCADVDRAGGCFAREEWAQLVPWLRPPWPSDQSKAYLRHYTREKATADRESSLLLTREATVIVGLANCGQLTGGRTQLTVLPLPVSDVAEAPCTVVADHPAERA